MRHTLSLSILLLALLASTSEVSASNATSSTTLRMATWNLEWLIAPREFRELTATCLPRNASPGNRERYIPCNVADELQRSEADFRALGRSYFPGVTVETFNEEQKEFLVADIAADLIVAANAIRLLPTDVRPAVSAAQFLFQELTTKVAATPANVLITTRIRVSNPRKLVLVAKALLGVTPN